MDGHNERDKPQEDVQRGVPAAGVGLLRAAVARGRQVRVADVRHAAHLLHAAPALPLRRRRHRHRHCRCRRGPAQTQVPGERCLLLLILITMFFCDSDQYCANLSVLTVLLTPIHTSSVVRNKVHMLYVSLLNFIIYYLLSLIQVVFKIELRNKNIHIQ